MREIKFRCWNGKTMGDSWSMPETLNELLRCDVGEDDFTKYTYMQYTGLKDKNGKEIYEGDIVRSLEFEETYIEQIPEDAMSREAWNTNGTLANIADGEEYEVIGNIHENKDLLDEEITR